MFIPEETGAIAVHDLGRMSRRLQILLQARARGEFVQIDRSIPGADQVLGYVVGVGSRWVVVSVISEGAPNGWVALLVDDIVAVGLAPGGRFVRRGLEFHHAWPAALPACALALTDDVQALIRSAAPTFPVMTIYVERQDPVRIVIGRPTGWAHDQVQWQEMNLEAAWEETATTWQRSLITRLDLGGQYESALSRVSDLRG